MRKLLAIVLPILILLLGAGGFVALKRDPPPPAPGKEKTWPVRVERVTPATVAPELQLYGRVDSPHVARLSAAVDADVAAVAVREGDRVTRGQELVRLDEREARLLLEQRGAEVAEVEAQIDSERRRHRNDLGSLEHEKRLLSLARREVERAEKLASSRVGSRSGLDQARQALERQALALRERKLAISEHASRGARLDARLSHARALQRRAALDLERTRVLAPFDARVSRVQVSPGDRVRTGGALLTLYDLSAMEIRAQIPTRTLTTLDGHVGDTEGLPARARVDGHRIEARLDRLGGEVNRGRGGTDGLFVVTRGAQHLTLGRIVELSVSLPAQENVLAVPYEAIYDGRRIFVAEGPDGRSPDPTDGTATPRLRGVAVRRLGEHRTDGGEARALVRAAGAPRPLDVVTTQLPNAVEGLRIRIVE